MRSSIFIPVLPLSAALLGACGGKEDHNETRPAEGVSFETGPFPVAAGGEEVVCSFFRMENEAPVEVRRLTSRQSKGGHHLIVYTVDHPIDSGPVTCPQGGQPDWAQILVSQLPEETVEMPEGVGLQLAPHQQLVIESHFINPTGEEVLVTGGVDLEFAPEGSVKEHAGVVFFGTTNIDIGPRSTLEKTATCSPPDDIHVFRLFGHEHRLGTGVRVEVGPKDGRLEQIYASTDWQHPEVRELDLRVGPESSVRMTCGWDNPTGERVMYPDEMCFAIGMYWPSRGQLFCTTSGLSEQCRCLYTGTRQLGAGGSEVRVRVGREEHIPGVAGDPSAGDHLYCRLYLPEEWREAGIGARPAYGIDAGDARLGTAADRAELVFRDVSPGEYQLHCFMDTVGGGFVPGPGAPSFTSREPIEVGEGETETVEAVLNTAAR